MLLLKVILLGLVGISNLIMGLAVLSRNIRRPMNIWFFILAAGAAGWVFGIAGFLLTNEPNAALNWAKFYYICPLVIVAASVIFAQTFPSGGKTNRLSTYGVLSVLVILSAYIAFQPNFLFESLMYHSWGKQIVLDKLHYLIYSCYLLAAFYLTLSRVYRKTKTEKGLFRAQTTVFFDGFLVSCILGVFFNLILPWFGNYQLIWAGPLATTFYLFATAYGIIRHRLFDVRAVAVRAVGYILSLLVLGGLYGILAFVVMALFLDEHAASVSERAASAALAVALALTFRPIKHFFDRATNRLFYRDAYDVQTLIGNLNQILVSTIDLDKLLLSATQLLQGTLKAQYCSLIISIPPNGVRKIVTSGTKQYTNELVDGIDSLMRRFEGPIVVVDYLDAANDKKLRSLLQSADISIVGSISSGTSHSGNAIGYLVFGPKKSGNPYGGQDIKAIQVVVAELAIAIQNALRFQEIRQFNVTLQDKIDQATRKLRKTNERLRLLDQTKDDFISMASHQLRTPLTSVKGYVSMVLDGDAGPINATQRKLLTQAFLSSQRMVYLISDLLNVSRLKTGKFIIEPVESRLDKVVEEELEQLTETVKSRGLTLTYHKPEHFPTLMIDETKIRQVIMNFVDNAIYYTPSGGTIDVYLEDKGASIEFRVVDTGIGVPKHEQHHLFTKFYRASNAKNARPDGTGLGIFMAKKVIIAQGGAVIFRSTEGKGSTFGFTFPKAKLLPPLKPESKQSASKEAQPA